MAEAKLEDAMQHVAQCPLTNIIQIQQCINMLQDGMHRGEETGASPVLLFAVEESSPMRRCFPGRSCCRVKPLLPPSSPDLCATEFVALLPGVYAPPKELLTDLRQRKGRYDEFHAERIAAWHLLQQAAGGLQSRLSASIKERKALQTAFNERSPKVPSWVAPDGAVATGSTSASAGFKEEIPVVSCSTSKSLQNSLDHFLELNLASTDEVQAETENLVELLVSTANLNAFFQLPTPSDVFQLNDRHADLASLAPGFKELAQSASPPVGPIPAILKEPAESRRHWENWKDCVRDIDKLLETWAKLVAEAMPKGLHQAILSGSSDLVAACLYVCVDKPRVFAAVHDDEGGGAVHVAAAEGFSHVIKVLVENGADVHEVNRLGQSALDIAIEGLQRQSIDVDLELCGRLQETVDLLHNEYKVISYEYVKYKKRGTWFKRPETMLKWLRIKHLLEHHFENLKRAFLDTRRGEIDTNHSGGIVKYEWEAMFGAEGQVKDALAAADLDSNDVFGMLDGLDIEGKD
eukprot:g6275.t1